MQSIFILGAKGDIILEKHFRGIVNRAVCDSFWEERLKYSITDDVPPVIVTPKHYFVSIQRNLLWFLVTLQRDFPPLICVEFLHRVADVLRDYFSELSEESLKENFLITYQLMDEVMDNGFPLTTEPNVLKEIIRPPVTGKATALGVRNLTPPAIGRVLPQGSQSNIRWRKSSVKYSNNEFYVDIVEEVEGVINRSGVTTQSCVLGKVMCNCHLSGLPDLTLVFQNPSILDDLSFHPCVRYNRFEKEKVVSFIPPDGDFQLMSYRVPHPSAFQMPLSLRSDFKWSPSSGRFELSATARPLGNGRTLEDVVITMTFPKVAASVSFHAAVGTIKYDEASKMCRWSIGKLNGGKSTLLSGTVSLQTGAAQPSKNPIALINFKISQNAASGLRVAHLHVENAKYKLFKGVRTITVGGNSLQFPC